MRNRKKQTKKRNTDKETQKGWKRETQKEREAKSGREVEIIKK